MALNAVVREMVLESLDKRIDELKKARLQFARKNDSTARTFLELAYLQLKTTHEAVAKLSR